MTDQTRTPADADAAAEYVKTQIAALQTFAATCRDILTNDAGEWRIEVSGADAIESLTAAIVALDSAQGLPDRTEEDEADDDDDGERTDCKGCGESWNTDDSDAAETDDYCSADCERRDGAGIESRGEA